MSAENRRSLPPCIEIPLVINSARETDGFDNQSREAQEAILTFASVSIAVIRDEDDISKEAFKSAWEALVKSGADETLAITVALKVAFQLPEELGNQW